MPSGKIYRDDYHGDLKEDLIPDRRFQFQIRWSSVINMIIIAFLVFNGYGNYQENLSEAFQSQKKC